MRIGADDLLREHGGSRLKVAEAFLRGDIKPFQEQFVGDLVDEITLQAAKIRIEWQRQAALEAARSGLGTSGG